MELYCRITLQIVDDRMILPNNIIKLDYEIALQNCITGLDYRIMLQDNITESCQGNILRNCITTTKKAISLYKFTSPEAVDW